MTRNFPFSAIVGQTLLRRALLLAAVDPGIGGVLIQGPRGMAKSTVARGLADLLPGGRMVTLPLGTTEERLVGTLNLERVLKSGEVDFSPGLLHAAHEGVLYVDEVNLLPDNLVDLLLDVAASGVNRVERDGISHQHLARFVLIGTMNPDEGELRPQLLDRFGMCVRLENDLTPEERVEIVRRRLAFDGAPEAFLQSHAAAQTALGDRCRVARARLHEIPVHEAIHQGVAVRCHDANVEGVRADLVMLRAARANAAFEGNERICESDIEAVSELALAHRRQEAQPPASSPESPSRRPPPPQNEAVSTSGDMGPGVPRSVPDGAARDVADLLKKKVLVSD